jgi:hypothetical protein
MYVLKQGVAKTASDESLFFERAFLTYLRDVFSAAFDLGSDYTHCHVTALRAASLAQTIAASPT